MTRLRKASDSRAKPAPLHNSGVHGVYEVSAVVTKPVAVSRHRLIDIHHRLNRVSGGLVIAITRGLSADELRAYQVELAELARLLKPDVRSPT